MTERKPAGVSFETWVEKQIREALERGEFDNLPGVGKPLQDEGGGYDENWWLKRKLRDEKVSLLPPTLALQRDVEQFLDGLARLRSEPDVRRGAEELNARIIEVGRMINAGPPLRIGPLDIDDVVDTWRRSRPTA